jgi:spermidine synthase
VAKGDPSRLLGSGVHAVIEPDTLVPGSYILSIGGAEQSHVNLEHPEEIFYEYLRRIGHLADLVAPPGEPITALHLGAGALTLARYIAATRPGSVQHAVELERELMDFVLRQLPLPAGSDVAVHIGDARDQLASFAAGPAFDLVILDVFAGADAPEHLTTGEFYREASAALKPQGLLVVNVGDDPGLAFARAQVRALREAVDGVAAVAERSMFSGRYPGNIVLAGCRGRWPADWTARLLAAGPHPAAVLTGPDLDAFAGI